MSVDLRRKQPGRVPYTVTLSSTAGTMTLVYLPKWVGRVIARARTVPSKWIEGDLRDTATDATPIGARSYATLTADSPREFIFRTGPTRNDIENWPPTFALASDTVSAVIELELEPW